MIQIKILGVSGTQRTLELTSRVHAALEHLEIRPIIKHESDLKALMAYNLIGIPALAINNKIVFQKEIPDIEAIVNEINAQMSINEHKITE